MEKAKRCILAILAVVLFASLTAFAAIQTISARAEDGVLPQNTAEYTFTNDTTNPWEYDR